MKTNLPQLKKIAQALALAGMVTLAAPALAATYNLRAEAVSLTMPDGAVIPMWGYALDGASCAAPPCAATVPGPALSAPPGDTTLTINLTNNLPQATSIVIPGQLAAMAPVYTTNSGGKTVVQSFTHEAAAGGGTASYAWNSLRPGTYLYQSGTHPQVQVQMGLYGSLSSDAASGLAYPGIAYDNQLLLLFSEIDPALHAAVTTPGGYGPGTPMSSTLDYQPKYFILNGKSFSADEEPLPLPAGQRTLLRFINAGLMTHVPVINGMDMQLVAEDGNPYPWPKTQYSALLPAAKTLDAVVIPQLAPGVASASYPLYDRRLYLNSGASPDRGMFVKLVAANGVHAPLMTSVPVTTASTGSLYAYQLTASDPDGGALVFSLVSAPAGMTLDAAGLISWTPASIGTQPVTARVTDPTGLRYDQVFNISVTSVNRAPLTGDDAATVLARLAGATYPAVEINVLANDSDPDAPANTIDPASVFLSTTPDKGGTATVNASGTISYRPAVGFTGIETFRYKVRDTLGLASSPGAYVRVTVNPANQPPLLLDDTVTAPRRQGTAAAYPAVIISVLANDSDPDGSIDPATVWITVGPNKGGTATVNADGTISYRPRAGFSGTETLRYKVRDNLGLAAPVAAYVRINVQ
ncbi:MAG: Ig-like domain-containing protein [Sulfuricella sp.]